MSLKYCKKKIFALITLTMIMLVQTGQALAESIQLDSETFEIQYAQAVVFAQDGEHEKALALCRALALQAPNNLDVINLLVQEAWTTGKRELLDQATVMRTLATQKAKTRERLEEQLLFIDKDISSLRYKRARERLDFVLRQMNSGVSPGEVQTRLVDLANALYSRSYFEDALWLYKQVINISVAGEKGTVRDPFREDDLDSVAVSLIMIEKLKKRNLFLLGTIAATYDSNPFEYPTGILSADGTPNNNLASTLKLDFTLRTPISDSSPFYYSLYAEALDYRSIAQRGRTQFDMESSSLGLGMGTASISTLRALLRYYYQYTQSPFAEILSFDNTSYNYSPVSRSHAISLDLTKDFATHFALTLNAHANFSKYVSFDDEGIYNRSGHVLGAYSEIDFQTESPWLIPLVRAGIDRDSAEGATNTFLEYYLRFGNYFHLLNGHGLINVEYDHYNYDQYPGGRLDNVIRGSLNIDYPMTSIVRFFAECDYSAAHSSFDFYTQNRAVMTAGLTFSIEN